MHAKSQKIKLVTTLYYIKSSLQAYKDRCILVWRNSKISRSIKPIFHQNLTISSFLDKIENDTKINQSESKSQWIDRSTYELFVWNIFSARIEVDDMIWDDLPAGTHLSSSYSDQAWDQSECVESGPTVIHKVYVTYQKIVQNGLVTTYHSFWFVKT